ncbi:hypothetical protein M409DRAFT_21255 [Zasmidium cellare ATCC 36951]|uniref:Uncharacterized protein n=1 Tax=Zasmidium cellare ATCC 36951 TaxID=1080233 RepID=A0A6A6CSR0_ZASCE|nr:uncharacterized protein M409DRAFT_21255 [Zasmidium cellare ATCC 36951]KAF2168506.1 hypothetical protein M409DRAFT_21255 [Zasmidium cellare ATCC 36951]
MSDFIKSLPSWAGTTFTKKTNSQVPPILDPTKVTLPKPFVAIVTGSSRGIGSGIAKCFAQAGATGLILTARTQGSCAKTEDECRRVSPHPSSLKISTFYGDNGDEAHATAIASLIETEHDGKLNLLVNNAGFLLVDGTAFEKVADINCPNIEAMTQTCYVGRFYMTKHLMPYLLSGAPDKLRAIANISSVGGHVSGPLGYSISCLATNRLSQRVDESYADQGLCCYAVHPGAVWSDGPKEYLPPRMKDFSNDSQDLCGSFLVWLCKERRQWLSGRYVDATWDVEELVQREGEIVEGDKLKMRMVV